MKSDRSQIDAVKRAARLDVVIASSGVDLKADGARLVGCCPFHQDDTPSLSVEPEKDGGVWHCHGGCGGGDVFAYVQRKYGVSFGVAHKQLASTFGVELTATVRKKVAEYVYRDASGSPLYSIERWVPGKNGRRKDFIQRRADGTPKKSAVQVPYGLDRLGDAGTVFVAEGEKCCEALWAIGVDATTSAGGSDVAKKTWTKEFCAPLAGRKVVVLPDNDEPGAKFASAVVAALDGIASSVVTIQLPLRDKGDDVVEWIAAGGTREQLMALAEQASIAPPASAADWRAGLLLSRTNEVRATVGNALAVLEHHPAFAGALYWDEHRLQAFASRALPWDRKGQTYPRHLTDDDGSFAARFLERDMGCAFPSQLLGGAIYATAGRTRRNPLAEYLTSQRWDGVPRIDSWLIAAGGAKDTPYVRAVSRAWLISAVARVFEPGCKVDHVLILEGNQGLKKSTMLEALASQAYFADHLPALEDKDTAMVLGRSWIIELAELEAMRKSESSAMKAFLTRRVDLYRPPYGRSVIEAPRRCVFAATTNEAQYLKDGTGNRRFWPVEITRSDAGVIACTRDQLWAEARAAYLAGEAWWLIDEQLMAEAREEQEGREQPDAWHQLVAKHVHGLDYCALHELFAAVGVDKGRMTNADSQRLGAILRKLGWTREQVRVEGRREWRYNAPDLSPGPEPGDNPVTPSARRQSPGHQVSPGFSRTGARACETPPPDSPNTTTQLYRKYLVTPGDLVTDEVKQLSPGCHRVGGPGDNPVTAQEPDDVDLDAETNGLWGPK